jgi:hypothetical protein
LIFGLGTSGFNRKCIEIVVSTLNSLGFFYAYMSRSFYMALMKNSFHIEGFKVFDGFGMVSVHCLEGNQILVGWFYNGCLGEASLEKV